MNDYDPNAQEDSWTIEYCGGQYRIFKDTERPRTAPKWYVFRCHDHRFSRRFYSRPSGAFLALSTGAIQWSDQ
jgi:hypothetical protein